jgi:hypothetical protein
MFNKRAKQAPIEFRNCKIRVEDDPSFIHLGDWFSASVSVSASRNLHAGFNSWIEKMLSTLFPPDTGNS